MERVIQSDQMPETLGMEGEKGHMKQEAPWRPPSRTKRVDELMHSGFLGLEEMVGKMSIKKRKQKRMWLEAELCVFLCACLHVPRLNPYTSVYNNTQIYKCLCCGSMGVTVCIQSVCILLLSSIL